ncbi:maleylpyruvate isomerase N-terminal domain-containing protein [Kocuria sp. M1R5S2]|uniref:maleylpyruvate isomerase N-terminal domain-containing protein n=1 Tax=Kocuria rhizosphaerae TaxID=3376285 RepID=UPI00379C1D9A
MTRTAFLNAGACFAELVAAVPPGRWSAPGLGSWDVRALVGHACRALTTLTRYLDEPVPDVACTNPGQYFVRSAEATTPEEVAARGVAAGNDLGEDPAATVRSALEQARAALARFPMSEDPVIRTAAGGMRLSAYLPTRTFELALHGLDLSAACGLDRRPPDHVLADAGRTAMQIADERGLTPEVLRALTGRGDLPEGFSLLG